MSGNTSLKPVGTEGGFSLGVGPEGERGQVQPWQWGRMPLQPPGAGVGACPAVGVEPASCASGGGPGGPDRRGQWCVSTRACQFARMPAGAPIPRTPTSVVQRLEPAHPAPPPRASLMCVSIDPVVLRRRVPAAGLAGVIVLTQCLTKSGEPTAGPGASGWPRPSCHSLVYVFLRTNKS